MSTELDGDRIWVFLKDNDQHGWSWSAGIDGKTYGEGAGEPSKDAALRAGQDLMTQKLRELLEAREED